MAKILLSIGDAVIREIPLIKERLTIGRRPSNDIVIDDLAISGEHAVIVTEDSDSFLEDLNSTNGTQINGQPVRKHFLQDGDVVELAQYRIRYVEKCQETTVIHPENLQNQIPVIKVVNGPAAGRLLPLNKMLTTIGRTDEQVAAIVRNKNDFDITFIEGEDYPLVNGAPLGVNSRRLRHGDRIVVAGAEFLFLELP